MSHKAIRAILGLYLLSVPAVTGAQDMNRLPSSRIACNAVSGVPDQFGQSVAGGVRKRCDALWTRSTHAGGVGGWRYGDFMIQCGRSCPAPEPVLQKASLQQLETLGAQAAQSVTSSAGAGAGAGASAGAAAGASAGAAAAAGAGFSTALLAGGGVAAALGIGVVASQHSPGPSDQPASP